ncbi:MAG: alpha/beta fold hydrolase [Pseudomonadota bacterium]
MKSFKFLGILIIFLSAGVFAEQVEAQETARRLDAKTAAGYFGKRPEVQQISLSSDGKKVSILAGGQYTETVVYWSDIDDGGLNRVISADGQPNQLRWCDFVANDRLICKYDAIVESNTGLLPFSRLISTSLNGDDMVSLGQKGSFRDSSVRQFVGSIIGWMPGDENNILFAQEFIPETVQSTRIRNNKEGLGVVILDTTNNKTKTVVQPDEEVSRYIADGTNIRIKAVRDNEGDSQQLSNRYAYYFRKRGSKSWEWLSSINIDTQRGVPGFSPVAIDSKSDRAFGFAQVNGKDALFAVSLDGNHSKELLFAHPEVDVDSTVRFGQDGRVVGVRYITDKTRISYFDPYLKKLSGQLSRAIPELPIIEFIDASDDENTLLILASSDSDPGRYFVFIKDKKELREISLKRPILENVALSSVLPIEYAARDGVKIPGYLTLPPGMNREDARDLPAIVMPHGGPASRDTWGFDWLAQFFAHIGYAVLQPNFRGSSGYGDDWFQRNGFQSWRTAISDVNDGARWLQETGVADAKRMAIVGWSYGGYAALQSDILEDSLYKAAVAIAPVTDMNDLVEESRGFTNFSIVRRYVGRGPHLTEGSPLQNIEALNIPVLLFHGDQDLNVSHRQSQRLESAMKLAGKDVRYVQYDGLDHQLPSSAVRANMLLQIANFLEDKMK